MGFKLSKELISVFAFKKTFLLVNFFLFFSHFTNSSRNGEIVQLEFSVGVFFHHYFDGYSHHILNNWPGKF